jgi:polar amino acid transport system permease protein
MSWRWDYVAELLPHLVRGLVVTLELTIAGMALALLLGLALAILKRSPNPWVRTPTTWGVEFVRTTPLFVQIYFLYLVLVAFWPPFAIGMVALGLHYATYTSEVYRAGIESVPGGQWDAARALGLTRGQTWRRVIIPQALPPVVPALGNYLIALFKDSPMAYAIGVLELLRRAQIWQGHNFRSLEPYTIAAFVYLALSLLSGRLVAWLERRTARRKALA